MAKKCFFITVALLVIGTGNAIAGSAQEIGALIQLGAVIVDSAVQNSNNSSSGSSSSGSSYGGSSGKTYYYSISTGHFSSSDGSINEICEAGAIGYTNRVEYIRERYLGPIPPGIYSINDVQQTLNGKPHENVIVLYRTSSESYGRDNDFRIHGGREDRSQGNGSNGCILMRKENRQKIASDFYNYGRGTLYVSE